MPTVSPAVLALAGPPATWQRLPDATNAVWRAGDVVVKQHRGDRPYRQELHAYTRWLPHLSEQTPALLAADDASHTLVLSRLPGTPLAQALDAERTAHHQAGAFLKILHAIPDPDPDPLPLAAAILQRHTAWHRRVAPHLTADDHTRLSALALKIPDTFADATRVPCHRDFTPRNWLIDDDKLNIVDFEHARHDTPLADLLKIAAETWPTRPDLERSLLAGYGRDLTARERAQLQLLVAIHAMATLAWAHDHADPTFLAAGRAALATALATAL